MEPHRLAYPESMNGQSRFQLVPVAGGPIGVRSAAWGGLGPLWGSHHTFKLGWVLHPTKEWRNNTSLIEALRGTVVFEPPCFASKHDT